MTNFQFKILSGLLFSLAICLGVFLVLPEEKADVVEVAVPQNPKVVVSTEPEPKAIQQTVIDEFAIDEETVAEKKQASAEELDAFFNELEESATSEIAVQITESTKRPERTQKKLDVKPAPKNTKTPFNADTLLSKDAFNLSFVDLKKKYNNRFHLGNITHYPKGKSKLFPLAVETKVNYDNEGLRSVRLYFKPKSFADNEGAWKTIWLDLQDSLQNKYGCDFSWETREDGSVLGRSSSHLGLRFILSYYSPDLIDRKDLSYITLAYGVEDSRIRLESVKKLNKDSELRAIANYIESKMYIAKKSIDLHNLKLQIGMFWKENQLENKSINYFYTGISNDDPYALKMASRGYPKIINFLGRNAPDVETYHRWTTVDGLVKKVEIISSGKVVPLFQTWHEKTLPAFSVKFTGSKKDRYYYLHEYDRGSLKKLVKLRHFGTSLSTEELTRVKYNQVYKFNKKDRLISALIRVGNDYFNYTDENKYRESSFAYGRYDSYYGTYSDRSISGVHLRGVFSRSSSSIEVTNVWNGIEEDSLDKSYADPMREVRNMLASGKNNWLLSYRTKNSTEPVVRQIAQNTVSSTVVTQNAVVEMPKMTVNASSLEEFLNSANLFSVNNRAFEVNMRKFGAVWTDKLKRSARSVTALKIGTTISHETLFGFRRGQLNKVTLMIYNKGDQDQIRKADYVNMQEKAVANVQKFIGKKLAYKPNAGLARNHLYWNVSTKHLVKLESNHTQSKRGFSAEYIRLTFTPPVKGLNAVNIDRINNDILTNAELQAMVSKEKDGSVYISGIPMVDQGQKGYCACAATARILNYYGKDIDQHEIAKLALSSAMGTGPDELKKALDLISTKLRLHFQTLVKCFLSNDNDIKRFLVKLERAYKKEGYFFNSRALKADELRVVFAKMAAQENRYKDFKKGIIRSIDSGRPLAWALILGIMPEADIPQASGGHMRLIIGYNEASEQIYYSDTWGAGHEKKVMDMQSAFWVSAALWELRPR